MFSFRAPEDIPEIGPRREYDKLVRGPVRPFLVVRGDGEPVVDDGERGGVRGTWGIYSVPSALCLCPSMVLATPRCEIIATTLPSLHALRAIPGLRRANQLAYDRLRTGGTIAGRIAPAKRLEGAFFLLGSAPRSYYHWLIEYLPNIALWRELAKGTKLLVPEVKHRWQRESLLLAGVAPSDIVEVKEHTLIEGDLTFADRINPTENKISRSIVPFFRAFEGSAGASGQGRRLFISRSLARRRRLVNEDEVLAELNVFGFEKVTAEDLPFAEQARLFAGAEMIAGPHGAGLANAAFAPAGAILVELRAASLQPKGISAFATLAGLFHHRYGLVFGETAGDQGNPRSADFSVSPGAVRRMVEALVAMRDGSAAVGADGFGRPLPPTAGSVRMLG